MIDQDKEEHNFLTEIRFSLKLGMLESEMQNRETQSDG
jgi:hypothetical protein